MRTTVLLLAFAVYLAWCEQTSQNLTKEEALDKEGKCVRTGSYKDDCNTCSCTAGRYPGCTKIFCGHTESQNGTLTKESALNSSKVCRKSGSYKDDCNTCSCTVGSYPVCTLIACPPKVPPEPSCIVPKCNTGNVCYTLYEPVCGVKIEFRNFSNLCFLGGEGCRDGFRWFKDGPCN